MNMPAIGQIVLITGINHNGRKTHPAMVTYANEENGTVNLQVFPDGAASYPRIDIRFTDGLFSETAASQADPIAHLFKLASVSADGDSESKIKKGSDSPEARVNVKSVKKS